MGWYNISFVVWLVVFRVLCDYTFVWFCECWWGLGVLGSASVVVSLRFGFGHAFGGWLLAIYSLGLGFLGFLVSWVARYGFGYLDEFGDDLVWC